MSDMKDCPVCGAPMKNSPDAESLGYLAPVVDTKAIRATAVLDFVRALEESRWHNFPVSVREFKEFAERYLHGDA